MATSQDFQHKRKISEIDSGEIENWVSSDGGTTWHPIKSDTSGRVHTLNGLVPHAYDYVSLSYTGSNLTGVVYKSGGSGGTTVATLVLTYDVSDNLETITKT